MPIPESRNWIKTKQRTPALKTTHRLQYETEIGGVEVTLIVQASGTLDTAKLVFPKFKPAVLQEVLTYGPDDCYPYVVIVPPEQELDVELACDENLRPFLLINPSLDDLIRATSYAQGVKKKLQAAVSLALDAQIVRRIEEHVRLNGFCDLNVFRPNGSGIVNEDLRITDNNDRLLVAGEGKRIAKDLNITERYGMLLGKAMGTHGRPYDLMWSVPSASARWMNSLHKAAQHHAAAYVEFEPDEQEQILRGDAPTVLQKKVQVPADPSNLADMRLVEGPTLGQYIIDLIQSRQ